MVPEILTAGAVLLITTVSVYLSGRSRQPVPQRIIRRPAVTADPGCPIFWAHIRRELEEDR